MDLKEERTEVLWGLVGSLSDTIATRELTAPAERTGLFKDTQNALQGILGALMQEINNRKPDSANV